MPDRCGPGPPVPSSDRRRMRGILRRPCPSSPRRGHRARPAWRRRCVRGRAAGARGSPARASAARRRTASAERFRPVRRARALRRGERTRPARAPWRRRSRGRRHPGRRASNRPDSTANRNTGRPGTGEAASPLTSTASMPCAWAGGSRSGPAGSRQPLPRPRWSNTSTSSVRARPACCSPSSLITRSSSGCSRASSASAAARCAPCRDRQAGLRGPAAPVRRRARRRPTRRARVARRHAPPGSRARAGRRASRARSSRAPAAMTAGVLPVPPASRLPRTTTAGRCEGGRRRTRVRRRCARTPVIAASGSKERAQESVAGRRGVAEPEREQAALQRGPQAVREADSSARPRRGDRLGERCASPLARRGRRRLRREGDARQARRAWPLRAR